MDMHYTKWKNYPAAFIAFNTHLWSGFYKYSAQDYF